jgi:hypothetical protein
VGAASFLTDKIPIKIPVLDAFEYVTKLSDCIPATAAAKLLYIVCGDGGYPLISYV